MSSSDALRHVGYLKRVFSKRITDSISAEERDEWRLELEQVELLERKLRESERVMARHRAEDDRRTALRDAARQAFSPDRVDEFCTAINVAMLFVDREREVRLAPTGGVKLHLAADIRALKRSIAIIAETRGDGSASALVALKRELELRERPFRTAKPAGLPAEAKRDFAGNVCKAIAADLGEPVYRLSRGRNPEAGAPSGSLPIFAAAMQFADIHETPGSLYQRMGDVLSGALDEWESECRIEDLEVDRRKRTAVPFSLKSFPVNDE